MDTDHPSISDATTATTTAALQGQTRKRRRAKVACEPCRDRKRKCNGQLPCETCVLYEYDCFYDTAKKARVKFSSTNVMPVSLPRSSGDDGDGSKNDAAGKQPGHTVEPPISTTTTTSPANSNNTNTHLESLEANSGAAFVRRLGLKIDPSNAPRLHLFAWNIGDRLAGCPPGTPRTITSMLSKTEMRNLASVYFSKVADAYGFIEREVFFQRLEERWQQNHHHHPTEHNTNIYDPVLCGVASIGFLFSQKFPAAIEPDLAETARTLLEQHSRSMSPPSLDTVTGWVVLVAYLRMSSLPHTTWLASCSMMHVAEAANIHLEAPSNTIFDRPAAAATAEVDLDIRRRLWGMVQHLHIWASFDLGRTKISIPGATTKPVATTSPSSWNSTDVTPQLLGLIPLTDQLDPNKTRSVDDLEADMVHLLSEQVSDPRVVMAHINLMLCIFRRLRAQKSNLPTSHHLESILSLAMKGIRAAQELVDSVSPWQHAANIPFQVICLLLAIDNRASLSLLGDAMRMLQRVANTWDTPVMREAYNTAYLLVLLHQRCKEEDAKTLRDVLGIHPTVSSTYELNSGNDYNGFPQQVSTATAAATGTATATTDSAEFLWLEDLIADMPSLREFDLEQFLVQNASAGVD